MGKSPAKWIKTVIFGMKPEKSSPRKKAATSEKESAFSSNTPSLDNNGTSINLVDEILPFSVSLPSKQAVNSDKTVTEQQEQAAITAQAILRGYLARRSFRAMKGIVRLQAVVRSHLVRRQAAATLRHTRGIIRLQALARGRKVRLSDVGREVKKKYGSKDLSGFSTAPRPDKLSSAAFSSKLLSTARNAKPLLLRHYDHKEPNSDRQWVERWSSSEFWAPLPHNKNSVDTRNNWKTGSLQPKKSELGRIKQVEARVSKLNNNRKLLSSFIHEKQITSPRNFEAKKESTGNEQPKNELERVKQSLRRISASSRVSLGSSESVFETPNLIPKIVSNSPSSVHEKSVEKSFEQSSYSSAAMFERSISKIEEEIDKPWNDIVGDNINPLKIIEEVEINASDEERISRENKALQRNYHKRNFQKRTDSADSGVQKSPMLPNYMMSTQSAKAKLKGFSSPRHNEQDEVENGGLLRRHSLPLFRNGKSSFMSSQSEKLNAKNSSDYNNGRVCRPGWKR